MWPFPGTWTAAKNSSGQIALMDSGKSSVVKKNELLLIDTHGDPDDTACPTTLGQRLRNILWQTSDYSSQPGAALLSSAVVHPADPTPALALKHRHRLSRLLTLHTRSTKRKGSPPLSVFSSASKCWSASRRWRLLPAFYRHHRW